MDDKKILKLRKIPLKTLLDGLMHLYNAGADYVDIIGRPDDIQDEIGLAVLEEYMTDEENMIEGEDMESPPEVRVLTDEDIDACLD